MLYMTLYFFVNSTFNINSPLTSILLPGKVSIKTNQNIVILNVTIESILSSKRFDAPPFQS